MKTYGREPSTRKPGRRYRKWKQIGHILRQDNESIAKKALKWNPQRGRRKGRPRIT
jgi:hypothetical protein